MRFMLAMMRSSAIAASRKRASRVVVPQHIQPLCGVRQKERLYVV